MTRRDVLQSKIAGKRVVIVGGGFGGQAVAKALREAGSDAHITMLEKRDFFMSCPLSNAYLGGLKEISLDVLSRDFYHTATLHKYDFVHCEVTQIERDSRIVHTTKGAFGYDYLVLSPGISYDYQSLFPTLNQSELRRISQEAPAGLITGNEHVALKRQLMDLREGNVVVTIPTGKFRCLTAPYERACMIASYMNKQHIKGTVYVLDASSEPRAKASAYSQAFNILYAYRVEYYVNAQLDSVDLDAKTITIKGKTLSYSMLNLIPPNRAHPLIENSGISVDEWGGAKMAGAGFTSVDDDRVYIVGDAVGHDIPASAQMANWAGKRAGQQIADRIAGKAVDLMALDTQGSGVCYSMVGDEPEEAIMETYQLSATEQGLTCKNRKCHVNADGIYRSSALGKGAREWYRGLMKDTFGV